MIVVDQPWEGLILMLVPFALLAVGALGLWVQEVILLSLGGSSSYNLEPIRPVRRSARWVAPSAVIVTGASYPFWTSSPVLLAAGLVSTAFFSFSAGLVLVSMAGDAVTSAQKSDEQKHPSRRRLSSFGNKVAFSMLSSVSAATWESRLRGVRVGW